MPTPSQLATAGGSTRPGITDQVIRAYMLAWSPPASVAGLLSQRGTQDRLSRWLASWAAEINRTRSTRTAGGAVAEISTGTRTWTAEWAGRDFDVSWRLARLPTPSGGAEVFDLGNAGNLQATFRQAVRPGGGTGLGPYTPRNWGEAQTWANNVAATWTTGAVYVAAFARDTLGAMIAWYDGAAGRASASASAAQAATAAEALERDQTRQAEAEAAALAERDRTRPARMATLARTASRIFGGDGRQAAKLRAQAENLGPLRARLALSVAADAVEAAETAGATPEEAEAAGQVAAADSLELSVLDVLYPLEPPEYYAATLQFLPGPWALLHLAAAYPDDPALAALSFEPPDYYAATLGALPQPWQNLFQQAAINAEIQP